MIARLIDLAIHSGAFHACVFACAAQVCAASVATADDSARFEAAARAYQAGNYDQALEQLAPLLARDPANDPEAARARLYAAKVLHRRGEEHFRKARIKESVSDFDRELSYAPNSAAGHWQRGISQYYAQLYAAGVQQFELHQTVNPQDVENAVWHFLCAVRAPNGTVEGARRKFIPITRDRRIPMKEVHALFAGTATPEEVFAAATTDGQESAQFYADLYVGLYYEALGKDAESLRLIQRAATNPSAQQHYMGDVARVHVQLRQAGSASGIRP